MKKSTIYAILLILAAFILGLLMSCCSVQSVGDYQYRSRGFAFDTAYYSNDTLIVKVIE